MSTGKLWVNPIHRVGVAEHKLWQLHVAKDLEIPIPATLISRAPDELKAFVQEVGSAICKPIFHGLLVEGDTRYSAFTRRVSATSFDERDAIEMCPVLLQAEVPRRADLRVTFIGNQCFAARISSSDPDLVDWRKPGVELKYEAMRFPGEIEEKCRSMLRQLGLLYGAFDFIERPDGQLVFLEVNPTGEWAWLENKLGFPMRKAFIQLFFGNGR
jgi:glutathione synthase/RimK-type ligase-like ATP-grasp enzyme